MTRAADKSYPSPSRRYRGPQGLGDDAARVLEQGVGTGQGLGGVAEESILKHWAQETGCLIPEEVWAQYRPITNHTSEHEVRAAPDG